MRGSEGLYFVRLIAVGLGFFFHFLFLSLLFP